MAVSLTYIVVALCCSWSSGGNGVLNSREDELLQAQETNVLIDEQHRSQVQEGNDRVLDNMRTSGKTGHEQDSASAWSMATQLESDHRDTTGDHRDTTGDHRDPTGDHRDPTSDHRDTTEKRTAVSEQFDGVFHDRQNDQVEKEEDIRRQYLINTVMKYQQAIADLQFRIKYTLDQIKHHMYTKHCSVFKLSKLLLSLHYLQNSLSQYNYRLHPNKNEISKAGAYTKALAKGKKYSESGETDVLLSKINGSINEFKWPIATNLYNKENSKLQHFSHNMDSAGGSKSSDGSCRSLEEETKVVIEFINLLRQLLKNSGLTKRISSKKSSRPIGIKNRIYDSIFFKQGGTKDLHGTDYNILNARKKKNNILRQIKRPNQRHRTSPNLYGRKHLGSAVYRRTWPSRKKTRKNHRKKHKYSSYVSSTNTNDIDKSSWNDEEVFKANPTKYIPRYLYPTTTESSHGYWSDSNNGLHDNTISKTTTKDGMKAAERQFSYPQRNSSLDSNLDESKELRKPSKWKNGEFDGHSVIKNDKDKLSPTSATSLTPTQVHKGNQTLKSGIAKPLNYELASARKNWTPRYEVAQPTTRDPALLDNHTLHQQSAMGPNEEDEVLHEFDIWTKKKSSNTSKTKMQPHKEKNITEVKQEDMAVTGVTKSSHNTKLNTSKHPLKPNTGGNNSTDHPTSPPATPPGLPSKQKKIKKSSRNSSTSMNASISPRNRMIMNWNSVAGNISMTRCLRCERRANEAVCGRNGQTYPTLCHAVNCAGLSLNDISYGDCSSKNVCADSLCQSDEVCQPLTHANCLTLYTRLGTDKLPCQQYTCTSLKKCKPSDVCGMNGETYKSLCDLNKARQNLAYTGKCRPSQCKDPVCGVDMNSYPSVCHAQARDIRVNHKGKCFPRVNEKSTLSTCVRTRELHLCNRTLCRNVVLPVDQCCPVCGGAVLIKLNRTMLYEFLATNRGNNHLYVVENLLRDKLPKRVMNKCHLYGYMTSSGAVSMVLEALNAGDHNLCHSALLQLQTIVTKAAGQPKFKTVYGMLEPRGWVRNKMLSFQHTVLEPPGYMEHERPGGIDKTFLNVEKYIYSGSRSHLGIQVHILFFSVTANL